MPKSTSLRRPGLVALVVAAGGALTGAARADFLYSGFPSSTGLNLVGAASTTGSALQLTPAQERVAGAAWHAQKQHVAAGFTSTFSFRITNIAGGGADGLAFVIQNSSGVAIGGTGGAMGYADNSYWNQAGIANSVAVEFDTWNNALANDWADPDGNHVSINTRGTLANNPAHNYSVGWSPFAINLSDGQFHTATITYIPGQLSVALDNLGVVATSSINLGSLLNLTGGYAWVGLTAATGGAADVEAHQVASWSYATVPTPGAAALLGVAGSLSLLRRRPRPA